MLTKSHSSIGLNKQFSNFLMLLLFRTVHWEIHRSEHDFCLLNTCNFAVMNRNFFGEVCPMGLDPQGENLEHTPVGLSLTLAVDPGLQVCRGVCPEVVY